MENEPQLAAAVHRTSTENPDLKPDIEAETETEADALTVALEPEAVEGDAEVPGQKVYHCAYCPQVVTRMGRRKHYTNNHDEFYPRALPVDKFFTKHKDCEGELCRENLARFATPAPPVVHRRPDEVLAYDTTSYFRPHFDSQLSMAPRQSNQLLMPYYQPPERAPLSDPFMLASFIGPSIQNMLEAVRGDRTHDVQALLQERTQVESLLAKVAPYQGYRQKFEFNRQ